MRDIGTVKWDEFLRLVSNCKGFQCPKYTWRHQKARTYMKKLVKLGFAKYMPGTYHKPSSKIVTKGDISFLNHEYVKDYKARFKTGNLTEKEVSLMYPSKLKEYNGILKNCENINESV